MVAVSRLLEGTSGAGSVAKPQLAFRRLTLTRCQGYDNGLTRYLSKEGWAAGQCCQRAISPRWCSPHITEGSWMRESARTPASKQHLLVVSSKLSCRPFQGMAFQQLKDHDDAEFTSWPVQEMLLLVHCFGSVLLQCDIFISNMGLSINHPVEGKPPSISDYCKLGVVFFPDGSAIGS